MSWIDGARARMRLLLSRDTMESRMKQEFAFHIEMETERLIRDEQITRDDARRLAMIKFGGSEVHKEQMRDGRGTRWLNGLTLDLKLGIRMLGKYPGLTALGVLALAIGIGVGAAYLEAINDVYRPSMHGKYGDRIVRLYYWNASERTRDLHMLHDLDQWKQQLSTVEELGAFRQVERNLILANGRAESVQGAEITASGLRVTGDQPILGRSLRDDDELPGASPVIVLGHALWTGKFESDPAVIGRTVRFGERQYTVVGVMQKGFGFPATENAWVPLQTNPGTARRGEEPAVGVFGRLVAGATVEQAQAELSNISAPVAAQFPERFGDLRARIKPYLRPDAIGDNIIEIRVYYALNLVFLALLMVCCANVGTLVFARTATREGELTVRNALGASRRRIVMQLFAEALVLTTTGMIAGLLVARYGLRYLYRSIADAASFTYPFWFDREIAWPTVMYAAALALVSALFIGVVPALKATGRHLQTRLKASAPGGSSLQFGKLWTGIIVAQVGLTVFFLFIVVSVAWNANIGRYLPETSLVATREYLTFEPRLDQNSAQDAPIIVPYGTVNADTGATRISQLRDQLERRLLQEPGVTAVTHATRLPGMEHTGMRIDVDGERNVHATADNYSVRRAAVGLTFFDALGRSIVKGRAFSQADFETNRNVVIVDERLARIRFPNANPIGRRIRRAVDSAEEKPEAWYEIIGVTQDLSLRHDNAIEDGKAYFPLQRNDPNPGYVALRTVGDPKLLAARARELAAEIDPALRLGEVVPMNEIGASFRLVFEIITRVLMFVGGVGILLSAAGVYSLMSFTVARRTREIGIRSALGADSRQIVHATFARGLRQIGIGVVAGSIPGAALIVFGAPEVAEGAGAATGTLIFAAISLFVLAVGALACIVPAKRALRIQPTEALRSLG